VGWCPIGKLSQFAGLGRVIQFPVKQLFHNWISGI
jgi:hypothetical protein